jgi:hypothetical protein
VGETVLLRLYSKLSYKYFGPYSILECIGNVAYRLELSPGSKIHNVFHVSQLKDYRADYTPVFSDLSQCPTLDCVDTAPEAILDRRMMKKGNQAIVQVLIKWKLPEEMATWEDWDTLKTIFPDVLTWGQASSSPGEV